MPSKMLQTEISDTEHCRCQLWGTGARVPSTSSNIFSAHLIRSRTKYITASSLVLYFIQHTALENVWNWQREAFYDARESTKIVFVFDRGSAPDTAGVLTTLLLIPLGVPGEGMPAVDAL